MTDSLAAALAELQTKLPEIRKSKEAKVETRGGGGFGYKYADLADVTRSLMPVMGGLGLSFVARPTMTAGGQFVLAYSLLHTSGEQLDGEYPLSTAGSPQAIGSAITYARRYALCAVTGAVADEDDDGKAAEVEHKPRRRGRREEPEPSESFDSAAPVKPDPEMVVLFDAFADEIRTAKDQDDLTKTGENVRAALKKGEITKTIYDQLARLGAAQRAGMNGVDLGDGP